MLTSIFYIAKNSITKMKSWVKRCCKPFFISLNIKNKGKHYYICNFKIKELLGGIMKRSLIAGLLIGCVAFTLSGCSKASVSSPEANKDNDTEILESNTVNNSNNENIDNKQEETIQEEDDKEKVDVVEEENNQEDDKEVNNNQVSDEESSNSGRILYYENFTGNSYYLLKKLSPNNKAKVIEIVEYLKENPPTDYLEDVRYQEFTPLPSDVEVNNVTFEDDLVTIDFNRNFAEALGSAAENSIIESLVNTVGYNLKKSKVVITFNGENYSSGHMVMNDGDYFEVKNIDGIKLNKN